MSVLFEAFLQPLADRISAFRLEGLTSTPLTRVPAHEKAMLAYLAISLSCGGGAGG